MKGKIIPQHEPMYLNEVHLIHANGKALIYDVMSKNIIEPTSESLEVLLCLKNNPQSISEITKAFSGSIEKHKVLEIISQMVDYNLLHTKQDYPKEPSWSERKFNPMLSPNAISLNITHKCNLRCIYCYGDGGSFGSRDAVMTLEVAKKAVDWVCGNVIRNGQKLASIIFFGGEPLMNFDIIEPIVNYANVVAKDSGLEIEYSMTTNGSLMSEEKARKLTELGISVLFSIDGPAKIQNSQRPFVGGGESYEACVEGAMKFKKISKKRISARVTTIGYNLSEITSELINAGFNNCFLSITSGDFGKHYMTKEGSRRLVEAHDDLFKMFTSDIDSVEKVRILQNNMFVKAIMNVIYRKALLWPCGAGRNYVGISPDGKIYLCHRFVGDERFYLGDVLKETFNKELYEDINRKGGARRGKCRSCWARMECAGGCYQMNLTFGNDLFNASRYQCQINKKLIEIGIKYYYKLYEKDPLIIGKICNIKQPVEYVNVCSDM